MNINKKLHETLEISGNLLSKLEIQDEQLNFIENDQNLININQEESKKVLRKMHSYLWCWYYGVLELGNGMVNYVYSTKEVTKGDTKKINIAFKEKVTSRFCNDKEIETNKINKSSENKMLEYVNTLYEQSTTISSVLDCQNKKLDKLQSITENNDSKFDKNNDRTVKIIN